MPVPLRHTTDLFHPPADPDDHYDLATAYALTVQGLVDLRGVVIDHPPGVYPLGDPAVGSVAQLNRIAGMAVPVVTGTGRQMTSRDDTLPGAGRDDLAAARFVLDTLRAADAPVAITMVGSCVDVAVAANLDPDLVARKCAAIYLNAGIGAPDGLPAGPNEYNITLAPLAYARMFDVPCLVYWMPCLPESPMKLDVGRNGTYYRFLQSEVLPTLPPALRAYFVFALSVEPAGRWLSYLERGVPDEAVAWVGNTHRNMWSTAGFLHAAGLGVTATGDVVDYDPATSVFRFDAVEVSCTDAGHTRWVPAQAAKDRFVFQVTDLDAYPRAMTTALATLLRHLA